MPRFRVESVRDVVTGKYYIELYYPEDQTIPVAVTKPIYVSRETAEADAVNIVQKGFPDHPIKVDRP